MHHHRRVISSFLIIFILAFHALGASAQQEVLPPWRAGFPEARKTTEITVGSTPVLVDLALTPAQQQLGLGYRNGLESGTGMFFVFPESSDRTFWMKGMRFCLDIIWIEGGEITGAAESVCPDPEGTLDAERQRFPSGQAVSNVLEVPAGWLASTGYGPGTPVVIPEGLS